MKENKNKIMATLIKKTETTPSAVIGWHIIETFTLENLSLIQMHIISQAMASYEKQGYQLNPSESINVSHAEVAEKFHDELIDLYTTEQTKYKKSI